MRFARIFTWTSTTMHRLRCPFALGLLVAVWPAGAYSQQTIFDVPSADVSDRHGFFFQHQTVARAWGPEKHWVQTNALGIGLGSHLEWDLTLFNFDPGRPSGAIGSTGFKASLPIRGEESRIPMRFVMGEMIEVGPTNGSRAGSWSYALINATVPVMHSRLTGGVHQGTRLLFGERTAGFLGGIEQPVSAKWMIQSDWMSGRHDLGYWIPGVVYHPVSHWMVSLGYQVPNRHAPGYRAVVLELTRI